MDGDLVINDRVVIPAGELRYTFARSSGPGGQHVNKSNTKVVLRWNVVDSRAITSEVRGRFLERFATRITLQGEVLLACDRHREQPSNRRECQERLRTMILAVLARPTRRIRTKPTRGGVQRRLRDKRSTSDKKQGRQYRGGNGD